RDKPRKRNPKKTKRKKRNPEKTKKQKKKGCFFRKQPWISLRDPQEHDSGAQPHQQHPLPLKPLFPPQQNNSRMISRQLLSPENELQNPFPPQEFPPQQERRSRIHNRL